MTLGELSATIRQVPGIAGVRRYQTKGTDRLYLSFSSSDPVTGIYVSLPTGILTYNREQLKWSNGVLWRTDPHELGERALKTCRALCETYRRERVAELSGGVK